MTEYSFRPLTGDDIFPVCKIISKLGADAIKTCLESPLVQGAIDGEKTNLDSVGIAVVAQAAVVIMGHMEECRDDLYGFLSSLTGLSKEEISGQTPAKLVRMISAVLRMEGFRDFFTAACELFGLATPDSSTSYSADTQTL